MALHDGLQEGSGLRLECRVGVLPEDRGLRARERPLEDAGITDADVTIDDTIGKSPTAPSNGRSSP